MKKLPVFSYILIILLALIILSIGMVSIFFLKALSDFIYSEVSSSLEEEASLIHNLIPEYNPDLENNYQEISDRILEDLNIRLTIINLDGKVLADTHKDINIMENHAERPEVIDALEGRIGKHTRYSETLSRHMLYVAIPPGEKGIIVRAAISVDHIREKFLDTFSDIAVFSVIILLVAVLISIFTANIFTSIILSIKDISMHYARGDFSKKLIENGPKEISQLKKSINTMGVQFKEMIDEVSFHKNELQAMLNSMDDSVILIDRNDNIQEMNPSAARLLNCSSPYAGEKDIKQLMKNEEILSLIELTHHTQNTLEKTIRYYKGIDLFLQVHTTPISGNGKLEKSILVVIHDISRVKQLENMRKDFVANVSHELKTPVTLINGFVETLVDGAINDREKTLEFLQVINRHSTRINNIIDDLLILSNIEDKGTNIKKERIVLYDILFSVYTSALSASEKENIKILVNCDEKINVKANPVLLEQAVQNLVNNAVKYAGKDTTIGINASVNRDNEVEIEVRDNGIGIEADQIERIFERFYRVNRQQSKKLGGTGLGLSIVKHIALAHNGRVDVSSLPGEGSTFRIFLPVL